MVAPQTNQQRIESLERSMEEFRVELDKRVIAAVNRVASGIQNTMVDSLSSTIEQVMKRMESSMVRSREEQERSREEQESFRKEMRMAMAALKIKDTTQCLGASSPAGQNTGHETGQSPGPGSVTARTGNGSGRSGDQFGGNWRAKKLDLPIFDGTNPGVDHAC